MRPRGAGRARVATAAVLFLLAGCGADASPEGAVQAWLDALAAGDTAAMQASFTDETRRLVGELEALSRQAEGVSGQPALGIGDWCQAFCGGTVEGSTLHGDSATVRVRVQGDVNEVPVVRAGERWRIDLSGRLEPAVQMLRLAVGQATGAPDAALPDTTPAAGDDPRP